MLFWDLVLFIVSLLVLVKAADYAVHFSTKISKVLHLSEFIVSFFIVSVISCLPEATVSILSAIEGTPSFGMGTLFGSNIADLSLVFGLVALYSAKGIRIKSQILRNDILYLLLLFVPILLGMDGSLTRLDGIILIICGAIFYVTLSIESHMFKQKTEHTNKHNWTLNLSLLIISIGFVIGGAHFTLKYGQSFAMGIGMPPYIIALTIVALGTCLPELIFSLKAVKNNHESLALGDLLGTVITDATIILGITALIRPFEFGFKIISVTGSMMFIAAALVIIFLKSDHVLSKREGLLLVLFYALSLIVELLSNRII